MHPAEVQAKATIAAALIIRGAVEVPTIPSGHEGVADPAGLRLRELTNYLYRIVTMTEPYDPA
jgi:hypothetical protein